MTAVRRLIVAAAFVMIAMGAAPARAAVKLTLSVTPSSITFPSADPDVSPTVTSAPVVVSYRVQGARRGETWQITVLASGDLISGPDKVDIPNVTWTATPAPPFQNGTLSKTIAQRMASGTGNQNPTKTGSVIFRLANSWNYTAGTYTQTLVFTLSSP